MGFPADIGIVDTMIGFPMADPRSRHSSIISRTKDRESREVFTTAAQYLFKDVPEERVTDVDDPVAFTLAEMDRWGIAKGMVGVSTPEDAGSQAVRRYPDRFVPAIGCDPNDGMDGIRRLVRLYEEYGVRAVTVFPAGTLPQVAINDKKMYPLYAKCVELGIPIFCNAGVPGPRLRFEPQRVEYIDEVMYDFPELVFVTRHGCEPWEDLAVKLMLKWPGLYYSPSAFAPKHYPEAIIKYANTRGADKVIYGGYFPMGLSLERIMGELAELPLKDEVWPKFLRGNAMRVLGLTE